MALFSAILLTGYSNERIPITSPFNGRPIKTIIRSTNNAATNEAKITCSIHFEPPYENSDYANSAPSTIAPGLSSDGHILFAEVHATGPDNNHGAVSLNWNSPHSGSYVASAHDIPSGSRITLSVKSDHNGEVCYVVATTFAWDYSSIGY